MTALRPLTAALLTACALLASCSEVTVTTPSPSPSAAPTLPPIGFNHRYGNTPVAATDARDLERALFAKKEYWEVALAGDPVASGFVDQADLAKVTASRAGTTGLTMVIASESLPTLRSFVANGRPAQQQYCQTLIDGLRAQGYTGLASVTMFVYFGENDRHAQLTWTPSGGYTYSVLDGDLDTRLASPPASGTPFPAVTAAASPAPTATPSPTPAG